MEHYSWDAVETETLSEHIGRKIISGEKAMVAQVFLAKGAVLRIPSNVPHRAVALEDTLDLDIFSPIRHDWLAKNDAYLRRGETA